MQNITFLFPELDTGLDRVIKHANEDRLVGEFLVNKNFDFKVAGEVVFFSGDFGCAEGLIIGVSDVFELQNKWFLWIEGEVCCGGFKR